MDGIIKITDNGGKTMDRYSAYFEDGYMLMMSIDQSPRGVCMSDCWKQDYIDNDDGEEIEFNNLPKAVQRAITDFMAEEV